MIDVAASENPFIFALMSYSSAHDVWRHLNLDNHVAAHIRDVRQGDVCVVSGLFTSEAVVPHIAFVELLEKCRVRTSVAFYQWGATLYWIELNERGDGDMRVRVPYAREDD